MKGLFPWPRGILGCPKFWSNLQTARFSWECVADGMRMDGKSPQNATSGFENLASMEDCMAEKKAWRAFKDRRPKSAEEGRTITRNSRSLARAAGLLVTANGKAKKKCASRTKGMGP